MAHVGERYCYMDIPKCASIWMRGVLQREVGGSRMLGKMHSWPELEWERREIVFAVIRHPADWLRSLWGYGERHKWRLRSGSPPVWAHLFAEFPQCGDFNGFIEQYLDASEGKVGEFFRFYMVPGIEVYRLEDEMPLLWGRFGKNWEKIAKRHPAQNVGRHKPDITALRNLILEREPFFQRYYQFDQVEVENEW